MKLEVLRVFVLSDSCVDWNPETGVFCLPGSGFPFAVFFDLKGTGSRDSHIEDKWMLKCLNGNLDSFFTVLKDENVGDTIIIGDSSKSFNRYSPVLF